MGGFEKFFEKYFEKSFNNILFYAHPFQDGSCYGMKHKQKQGCCLLKIIQDDLQLLLCDAQSWLPHSCHTSCTLGTESHPFAIYIPFSFSISLNCKAFYLSTFF